MWLRSSAAALVLATALLGGVGVASEPGGPTAREQARAEIAQAQRDSADIERRYKEARRECQQGFVVNPCLDAARHDRDRQLRAAREREVAARDALRRLDAEERARKREEKAVTEEAGPGGRAGSSSVGKAAAAPTRDRGQPEPPRTVDPAQKEAEAARRREEAAQRKAQADSRTAAQAAENQRRAAERAAKAAQAPSKVEEYEQRQREAQAHAEEKARAAEENQKRRERRAQEREAAKAKAAAQGTP
jgi:hypothetical protein